MARMRVSSMLDMERGAINMEEYLRILEREKDIQEQIDEVSKKMKEYAPYGLPYYRGSDKEIKEKKFYEYQKQYWSLRNQLGNILKEEFELRKKDEDSSSETFVNSYGEATDRYITSPSYEKAQRKLEKQIMRVIGG